MALSRAPEMIRVPSTVIAICIHGAFVDGQLAERLTVWHRPDPDRAIVGARYESRAVGRECQAPNHARMSFEAVYFAGFEVHLPDDPVAGSERERIAIIDKGNAIELMFAAFEKDAGRLRR